MPTTEVAFFRISGKDFTRIARDIMLSEDPAKAWRTISEVPDAVTRYPEGMKVTLLPGTGQIITHWDYTRT